ncbi:hypothetical protein KSS87_011796 [Heliosperma pusillum]|nr:hypothetical protein KSS87_011796 [Heliosperma pusillum]
MEFNLQPFRGRVTLLAYKGHGHRPESICKFFYIYTS